MVAETLFNENIKVRYNFSTGFSLLLIFLGLNSVDPWRFAKSGQLYKIQISITIKLNGMGTENKFSKVTVRVQLFREMWQMSRRKLYLRLSWKNHFFRSRNSRQLKL